MSNIKEEYFYNIKSTKFRDIDIDFIYTKNGINKIGEVGIPHLHIGTEVVFSAWNDCVLVTGNKTHYMPKNSVCLIPAGVVHAFGPAGDTCKFFSYFMRIEDAEKTGFSESSYHARVYSSFDDVIIFENCDKIIGYINDFTQMLNNENYDDINISNSLLQLVFMSVTKLVVQKYNLSFMPSVKNSSKNIKLADYVLENFIMDNYTRDITIYDVATYIGYSSTYTARKIKKIYGITYSELLTKLRMIYAKKLLLETNKPFFKIAEEVGFNSYNGFGLAFKKFYKKTPEQVRNEYIGNI